MSDVLGWLRGDGWSVAAHNDYRQLGQPMTFWLLTNPDGTWLKGEGHTDDEALLSIWRQFRRRRENEQGALATAERERDAFRDENERLRAEVDRPTLAEAATRMIDEAEVEPADVPSGKLIRDRSTKEKDEWWDSVQEAAADARELRDEKRRTGNWEAAVHIAELEES